MWNWLRVKEHGSLFHQYVRLHKISESEGLPRRAQKQQGKILMDEDWWKDEIKYDRNQVDNWLEFSKAPGFNFAFFWEQSASFR